MRRISRVVWIRFLLPGHWLWHLFSAYFSSPWKVLSSWTLRMLIFGSTITSNRVILWYDVPWDKNNHFIIQKNMLMIVDDHHFKIGKKWRFNIKPRQKGDWKHHLSKTCEAWSLSPLSIGFTRSSSFHEAQVSASLNAPVAIPYCWWKKPR